MKQRKKRRVKNTSRKGARFENIVKHHLQDRGYNVIRSAASRSPVDLVASKDGSTIFVQCKSRKQRVSEEMISWAQQAGAIAFIAYPGPGKKLMLEPVLDQPFTDIPQHVIKPEACSQIIDLSVDGSARYERS